MVSKRSASNRWFLYIIRAADGTLYTGIARDAEKRLAKHLSGKGSRYLRGRSPLKLIYREAISTHSLALKRELKIKRLTRSQKLMLIKSNPAIKAKSGSLRPSPRGLRVSHRVGS